MKIVPQFFKFSYIGAIGTLAQYLVLILLNHALSNTWQVFSSGGGFIVGALTNYMLTRRYLFKVQKTHAEIMPRFFAIALLGLGINSVIMFVLANLFGLYYLLAQCIATAVVLMLNFSLHRIWTFKSQPCEKSA